MQLYNLLLDNTHAEWHAILLKALKEIDKNYLTSLQISNDWLPGFDSLLAAFSIPLHSTRYILLGESPYPRASSANGYAFWDAAVGNLWSTTGLSKEVNRATSLRNFIKMLLVAKGSLKNDLSQPAIAAIDKSILCKTGREFFLNFLKTGFLLLNVSLVYSEEDKVKKNIKQHVLIWQPFILSILQQLTNQGHAFKLILLGKFASSITKEFTYPSLVAEHPCNLSFISNPDVIDFFRPLDLLLY